MKYLPSILPHHIGHGLLQPIHEDAISSSSYQTTHHFIAGVAYRPVTFNWLNTVGKYEFKSDDNRFINPYIDYTASIIR
jgi:hypothetical protein